MPEAILGLLEVVAVPAQVDQAAAAVRQLYARPGTDPPQIIPLGPQHSNYQQNLFKMSLIPNP